MTNTATAATAPALSTMAECLSALWAERALITRMAAKAAAAGCLALGKAQAEDMTQEIILALAPRIGAFDPTRGVKFSSYVGTLALRAAIDLLRKEGHRVHGSLDVADEDDARAVPRVEKLAAAPDLGLRDRERLVAVLAAIPECLSPGEAAMIMAMLDAEEAHGFLAEYARKQGVPVATARTHFARAVAKLRAHLEEDEDE